MTQLAATLQDVFASANLRPADICRSTGLDNSLFTRLLRKGQRFIDCDTLGRILAAVPHKDRPRIIIAHLEDVKNGLPGADKIMIVAPEDPRVVPAPRKKTRLAA